LAPKKKAKVTKAGSKTSDKESYVPSTVKRTNISEKLADFQQTLEIRAQQTNDPVSMAIVAQEQNLLHKSTYMTIVNAYGSMVDVATYLSQRLSKDTTYYQMDSTLFSIMSFLHEAMTSDPETYVDLTNVNSSGNMKVLRGFKMFADAVTEIEEYDAITTLYNDFVIGIVDRGSELFANRIVNIIGYNCIGQYNSSNDVRGRTFQQLIADMPNYGRSIYPLVRESTVQFVANQQVFRAPVAAGPGAVDFAKYNNFEGAKDLTEADSANVFLIGKALQRGAVIDVQDADHSVRHPTIHISRAVWLNDKGEAKRKSLENQMNLSDVPAYALHLGIVEYVSALVPAKFRPEIEVPYLVNGKTVLKKRVHYPLLGLNPALSHHLMYAHGIDFKPVHIDSDPGRIVDANGKPTRLRTPHQALESIIQRVSQYFEVDKDGSCNVIDLIKREKFIDIHEADFTQAYKFNLVAHAKGSSAMLFPDVNPPNILAQNGQLAMTKEQIKTRPDLVLDILLYSIGFRVGKVAVNHTRLQETVRGLYSVFSEVLSYEGGIPTVIQFNTLPVDRSSISSLLTGGQNGQVVKYTAVRGSLKAGSGSVLTTMAPPLHHVGGQTAPLAHHPAHHSPVQQSATSGMI
jgi:hypothetical protein